MMAKLRLPLLLRGVFFLMNAAAANAQDRATVTVWMNDDELSQCVADTWTDMFNQQSETAQVNFELQPSVNDTLRTALAGGAGPDIIATDSPAYAQELAKANFLVPLDTYVDQYDWNDRFVPWA